MRPEFINYFRAMALRDETRPRVEAALAGFEAITGIAAEACLLMPGKDVMGNDAFDLWLFGGGVMMNCGKMAANLPTERVFEVEALARRVQHFKLAGRHFDPLNPGQPHDIKLAELRCELQLVGRLKAIEFVVYGINCAQLHRVAVQFFGGNLVN